MTVLSRTLKNQSAADWQGMIKEINTAAQERARYLPIMTQFERESVANYLGDLKDQCRPAIEAGALAAWNTAKANLKAAFEKKATARRKLINSWDAGKLAAEMQVYSMRVERAAKAADLEALRGIYSEAFESGDRFKVRAAAEALQGAVNLIPVNAQDSHGVDMRRGANRLVNQANRDLEALQTSPELTQADELAAVRVNELNQAKGAVFEAAETLGDTAPNGTLKNSRFIDALSSVKQNDDGNFIFQDKE
jgi:hypothetical protein